MVPKEERNVPPNRKKRKEGSPVPTEAERKKEARHLPGREKGEKS